MKKLISITLTAALLTAALAGCAKTENSGSNSTSSNATSSTPAQTTENAPAAPTEEATSAPAESTTPESTTAPAETVPAPTEEAPAAATEEAPLPVGSTVIADWAENVQLGENFTEISADESEYQGRVVFTTDGAVSDFKLLALTFVDIDDEGHIIFDISEVYTQPALTADLPLVVNLTFIGEIPNYGISYENGTGEVQRFSLNESGFDGSLILSAF